MRLDRTTMLMLGVILLATFIAYVPTLSNGFVNLDDDKYILNNSLIQSFSLGKLFSTFVVGNYHPLTMLSYTFEQALFGQSAAGYHFVSLLLHLANTVFVMAVILELSGNTTVALIATLLFAMHPVHVESIAWASERKDLLYTAFFLGSLLTYMRFMQGGEKRLYTWSIVLFLCALLSKAMAASLPLVLLLVDYYHGRTIDRKVITWKLPYVALAIIFGIVAISAQRSLNALHNLAEYSTMQRLIFANYAIVNYLIQLLAPLRLSAYYPYPVSPGVTLPASYFAFPLIVITMIVAAIVVARKTRLWVFVVGFFLSTVALVLQVLPVGDAVMADRYMYIPSIAFCFGLAMVINGLMNQKPQLAIGVASVVALLYGVQTYSRSHVWRDSLTLWNDVIEQTQSWALAYNNRGVVYMNEGKTNEAYADFSKAVELRSTYPDAYNNRGMVLQSTTRYEEMRRDFNKAIELRPDFFEAWVNRGSLSQLQKRHADAVANFDKAISLQPDHPILYCSRGLSLIELGRKAEACSDFSSASSMGFRAADDLLVKYCR
jgi:Tfp pilus assembly protein PilF